MWLVSLPSSVPWLFWLVALAMVGLQSFAGYRAGLFIVDSGYASANKTLTGDDKLTRPTDRVRVWAYAVPHAVFYAVCSFAGFAAWLLADLLQAKVNWWQGIDGGTATALVALAAFAVTGVSGALPRILYLGGRPV